MNVLYQLGIFEGSDAAWENADYHITLEGEGHCGHIYRRWKERVTEKRRGEMVDRERGNGVQSKKEKSMVRERKRDGDRE